MLATANRNADQSACRACAGTGGDGPVRSSTGLPFHPCIYCDGRGYERARSTNGIVVFSVFDAADDKIIIDCLTLAAAERELRWRGPSNRLRITQRVRPVMGDHDPQYGLPVRRFAAWPDSKTAELKKHYEELKSWRWIVNYFEESSASLGKKLNQLGVIKRASPDHPMHREGGHMRLWLYQLESLLQMFDQDFAVEVIALELNRTEKAVVAKLISVGAITRKLNAHVLGYYGDSGFGEGSEDTYGRYVPDVTFTTNDALPREKAEIRILLDKLHPRVVRLVERLMSGDTLTDARVSAGLTEQHLEIVLPALRGFLAKYLHTDRNEGR